ncbi:F0F1 ATP synthase subunit delta [Pandoraea nosoerga]|uniref:ATP synthase subunit delta n=1 Tax=Pandoraea nosoerga TaxID=2508296 RepID=A0A5E4UM31_9BURK|nr:MULTISPECIES: F0F1 ATP synthase subunit delta [Pandoraea]MBN4664844.1 F0F1 ATP synthase subunit delta [Pandoraea nosoerga]MBN4673981.1 F0F1 ATP synthase subunit delta [Pandoraea nosoerga]MBN4680084.1 F0F1 ATP synthase subunit delta [Pandoraea nosoerga]MBN4744204.1 F0F1 ATP synthase subunit delta [Pandoraea nosoerga]VVD99914.1 ATP synthase F0F1 subunit delta [Pandoraea nosoerga]
MAELATIARPYAEALFRVAKAGDLNRWSELVRELAQVAALPEVANLADDPKVTPTQVVDVLTAAVKSTDAEVRNFVAAVVENGRLAAMPEIAGQFEALKNAAAGSADALIESAFPLEGEQLTSLVKGLEHKFGRKLNPTVTVDSSLIGGVRVVVGDEVLDTSVRARLAAMRTSLTA